MTHNQQLNLQALFAAALDRYQAGAVAQAASLFTDLLQVAPAHADARRLRGLALVRAGQGAAGLSDLAMAVRLAPADPLTHLHHGVGLLTLGHYARAAARFRRATMLGPGDPAPWINFTSALLALGKPGAARAAARRALRLAPGNPDALQALARGHAAQNELDQAADILRRLLRLAPGRASAWVDFGLLQARRGAMNDATRAMQSALKADPDCTAAAANLAGFSVLTGDQDKALATLRDILTRDPACVPARLNLANALLLDREAASALDVLQGTVPPGREGAHWRAHQALALILLGQTTQAQVVLKAIPEPWDDAEILIVNRHLQLARRGADARAAAEGAARLETLSRDRRFLFDHRVIACFDLARHYHECGEPSRAFTHWRNGHELLREVQPFSRDTCNAFIDASIALLNAERLHQGARAANHDATPVFIVGLPRSGTTLTEQILSSHARVYGAGERSALHNLILQHTGSTSRVESVVRQADFDIAALDAMGTEFLNDLREEAPEAQMVIDKMPGNALHLGFISMLLPGAKIIHCTRDPRDVGLSIFQLRFFGYHPYAHDLADLGFYITEHERLMRHWRQVLPLRMIEVALTDWTDDFSGTLARILEFLGLPYDPSCERFYENRRQVRTASAAQIRAPVNRRGIGRWRVYENELGPLLEALKKLDIPSDDSVSAR